jgi:hypothetical protein
MAACRSPPQQWMQGVEEAAHTLGRRAACDGARTHSALGSARSAPTTIAPSIRARWGCLAALEASVMVDAAIQLNALLILVSSLLGAANLPRVDEFEAHRVDSDTFWKMGPQRSAGGSSRLESSGSEEDVVY